MIEGPQKHLNCVKVLSKMSAALFRNVAVCPSLCMAQQYCTFREEDSQVNEEVRFYAGSFLVNLAQSGPISERGTSTGELPPSDAVSKSVGHH